MSVQINENISISFENITVAYGEKTVLQDFTHTFKSGFCSVIMAPSGAGKTTLLNVITGTVKPSSGKLNFSAEPFISMVFQENLLMPHTDVITNLLSVINTHGMHYSRESLENELNALGLSKDILHAPITSLSGGMQRRIAILRAVLAPSNIILFDEPFKGLDEKLKLSVMDYIKKRTAGKTVLLITHDKSEALYFSPEEDIFKLPSLNSDLPL